MRDFRLKLEAAGFPNITVSQLILFSLAAATLVASWLHVSFGVIGLSLFGFLAVIGFVMEGLMIRAKSRTQALTKLWPEVLDSLHSSLASGYGLVDSLAEIATSGPSRFRPIFANLVNQLDAGKSLDEGLDWFKSRFGQLQADRLAETIRVVQSAGGAGLLPALRTQSSMTRAEIALIGELETKQGWITGTAKLSIIAPWIIVATLASRSENVAIYNTNEGLGILALGLIISLLAFRMVTTLGQLTLPNRTFTK